jgi:tetratricopeptide (TPR) repeat protein
VDYNAYMKREIEKTLFIEINKDITLNLKGNPVMKKGEYPVLPEDMVNLAKNGLNSVPAAEIIKAMIHIIACDREFKYNTQYIDLLKLIEGIENYIVMEIENNKKTNLKKAVIYTTALSILNPKKEYLYNRAMLLMQLYEKTGNEFINEEIISSLEKLCETYPNFSLPFFHLGQYYLDKDIDKAKLYLRKCENDPTTRDEAVITLEKIKTVEEYDNAVELVKNGQGMEALKILIPICNENPENLDAIYYAAVAFRQTENHQKAVLYLNELLQHGERVEVYAEIALNLAALDDFEASLIYFKKALKIMPDDAGIICNIGVCYLNLGQFEEAEKAFGLASRINPKDEIAKMWLEKLKSISK